MAGGGFDIFLDDFEGDRAEGRGSCSVVADGRGTLMTGSRSSKASAANI